MYSDGSTISKIAWRKDRWSVKARAAKKLVQAIITGTVQMTRMKLSMASSSKKECLTE